jgi:predicted kinase
MCGLPGSGKSTLAKAKEEETGAVRLSPDEWLMALGHDLYDEVSREKVEALQWKLAQRLLSASVSVILENGFWSRSERDAYRKVARELNAATRIHYLHVELGELKRRIATRNENMPVSAQVSPDDIDSWAALFDPPTKEEMEDG